MTLLPATAVTRAGRQFPISPALLASIVVTAIILASEAARGFSSVANLRSDNDSLLRMVEIRDLLAGQGWFDLTQYRLGLDGGTLMHWSRLIDAPLAATIWVVTKLTGSVSAGETVAAIGWPLLNFAISLYFLIRVAVRLGGESAILPAAVIGGICLYSIGIFMPGNIDHHNVQFALTIATISLLLDAEHQPRRAWPAGVTAGLSIAIGMETAPFIAAFGSAVAVLYLWQGERLARMAMNYGIGFACTGVMVMLAMIAPARWLTPTCDAFSVVQFVAIVSCGAGLAVAAGLPSLRGTLVRRAFALGAVALLVGTLMAAFFPQCLAAPFADLDPRQKVYWLDHVREAQSAWATLKYDPAPVLGRLVTPLLALTIMAVTAWRTKIRYDAVVVGICLAAATLVSFWQIRGGAFAAGLAVMPLAAWVGQWRDQQGASLTSQLKTLAAWLLSLNLTWGGVAQAYTAISGPSALAASTAPSSDCTEGHDLATLGTLPAATVLSGINQGSPILYFTQHRVIAAPYHRNAGNIVAYEAYLSDPAKAHQLLLDNKVSLVAVCRQVDENPNMPADSLNGRLMRGEPPSWLEIVPAAKGQPIEVYRVAPAAS